MGPEIYGITFAFDLKNVKGHVYEVSGITQFKLQMKEDHVLKVVNQLRETANKLEKVYFDFNSKELENDSDFKV